MVSKNKKGAFFWLVTITSLVTVCFITLLTLAIIFFPKNKVRTLVVSQLSTVLRRDVVLGDADLAFSAIPTIVLKDLRISGEYQKSNDIINMGELRVSIALMPLLSGKIELGSVSLHNTKVYIERNQNGRWSFDSILRNLNNNSKNTPDHKKVDSKSQTAFYFSKLNFENLTLQFKDDLNRQNYTLNIKQLNGGGALNNANIQFEMLSHISQLKIDKIGNNILLNDITIACDIDGNIKTKQLNIKNFNIGHKYISCKFKGELAAFGAKQINGNLNIAIGSIKKLLTLMPNNISKPNIDGTGITLESKLNLNIAKLHNIMPLTNLVEQNVNVKLKCKTLQVQDQHLQNAQIDISLDGEALRVKSNYIALNNVLGMADFTLPLSVDPIAELDVNLKTFDINATKINQTNITISATGLNSNFNQIDGKISVNISGVKSKIDNKYLNLPFIKMQTTFKANVKSQNLNVDNCVVSIPGADLKTKINLSKTNGITAKGVLLLADFKKLAKSAKPWISNQPLQIKKIKVGFEVFHPADTFDLHNLNAKGNINLNDIFWDIYGIKNGNITYNFDGDKLNAQLKKIVTSNANIDGSINFYPNKIKPTLQVHLNLNKIKYQNKKLNTSINNADLLVDIKTGVNSNVDASVLLNKIYFNDTQTKFSVPKLSLKTNFDLQSKQMVCNKLTLQSLGVNINAKGIKKANDNFTALVDIDIKSLNPILKVFAANLSNKLKSNNINIHSTINGDIKNGIQKANSRVQISKINFENNYISNLKTSVLYNPKNAIVDIQSLHSNYGVMSGLIKLQLEDGFKVEGKTKLQKFVFSNKTKKITSPMIEALFNCSSSLNKSKLNYTMNIYGNNLRILDKLKKQQSFAVAKFNYGGKGIYNLSNNNITFNKHKINFGNNHIYLDGNIKGKGNGLIKLAINIPDSGLVGTIASTMQLPLKAKGLDVKLNAVSPNFYKANLDDINLSGYVNASEIIYDYHLITDLKAPFNLKKGTFVMPKLHANIAEGHLDAHFKTINLGSKKPFSKLTGSLNNAKISKLVPPTDKISSLLAGDATCSIDNLSITGFNADEIRQSINGAIQLQLENGKIFKFKTLPESSLASQSSLINTFMPWVQSASHFDKWLNLPETYTYSISRKQIKIKNGRVNIPEIYLHSDNGVQIKLSGTIGSDDKLDLKCQILNIDRFVASKYKNEFKNMKITERIGGTTQEPKLLTNNFQTKLAKQIAIIQVRRQATKHLDSKIGGVLGSVLGVDKSNTAHKSQNSSSKDNKQKIIEEIGKGLLQGLFK